MVVTQLVVLGVSGDLVTIYSWGYNPIYNWSNHYKAIWGHLGGVISRVISPVMSSY